MQSRAPRRGVQEDVAGQIPRQRELDRPTATSASHLPHAPLHRNRLSSTLIFFADRYVTKNRRFENRKLSNCVSAKPHLCAPGAA